MMYKSIIKRKKIQNPFSLTHCLKHIYISNDLYINLINKKNKNPSSFHLMNCLSNNYYSNLFFINLFAIDGCGPAGNRTQDFCLTDKCFTIKLMAHNKTSSINYLNSCCRRCN